ncbi:MAG: hypothetical protein IPK19_00380 [Chloroflexi bacterium]|nr:hypothetical protein [Chloroflexota bacterium]
METVLNILIVWFLVSIPASLIIGALLGRRATRQAGASSGLWLSVQRLLARRGSPQLAPGKTILSRPHLYL